MTLLTLQAAASPLPLPDTPVPPVPVLQVSSTLDLPYPPGGLEPHQVDMPAIPNQVWPSDHLAMGCDLLLGGDSAAGTEGSAAAGAAGSGT